jgi:Ran GTPase-activating protein (RanGAP) involved in mRNA processing and transport
MDALVISSNTSEDYGERDVYLQYTYSTVSELILLLKQLRLNDRSVKKVNIQCKKLPIAYLNAFFTLLVTNNFVTHVVISKCNITDEVIAPLTAFLRSNKTVIDLDISKNKLSDSSCSEIAASLVAQQALRRLVLEGNPFTENGLQLICNVIPSTNLQVLKVGKISLGEVGANSVAKMLMNSNCTLRKLDLRSCNLASIGTSILSEAIVLNKSLETLCLGKNNIDDSAVQYIVAAIRDNDSLLSLDLQYNPITDTGAKAIAKCLDENNYSIRRIKLRHCDEISTSMKEMLLDILLVNSYGPELAFKTRDALRFIISEEESSTTDIGPTLFENLEYHRSVLNYDFNGEPSTVREVPPALSSIGRDESCVICFEDMANCVLLPCMHRNCCDACANKMKSCHMCRGVIVKVFQRQIKE